jgi:hypothetical protein
MSQTCQNEKEDTSDPPTSPHQPQGYEAEKSQPCDPLVMPAENCVCYMASVQLADGQQIQPGHEDPSPPGEGYGVEKDLMAVRDSNGEFRKEREEK